MPPGPATVIACSSRASGGPPTGGRDPLRSAQNLRAARLGGLRHVRGRTRSGGDSPKEPSMTRLSGITPSGHAQLGNYLGAIQRWARHTTEQDLYFVSDLHALTSAHNPARLRALTRETLAILLGPGIPDELGFVKSDR